MLHLAVFLPDIASFVVSADIDVTFWVFIFLKQGQHTCSKNTLSPIDYYWSLISTKFLLKGIKTLLGCVFYWLFYVFSESVELLEER